MRRPLLVFGVLVTVALVAAGCGDDKKSGDSASTPTSPATTPASTPDTTAPATKPRVTVPSGAPPSRLVVKDLRPGSGQAAKPGDTVTVQYVGVNYKDGKQFDASWDRGQAFSFQLGANMVIPGWDRGLVGMKPGGRRELIIPPGLAYGAQGSPPAIPPNSTLVFVVDLQRLG